MGDPVAAGAATPASELDDRDGALIVQLGAMLDASRAQQRHLRTSILRVLEYLEHPSTR